MRQAQQLIAILAAQQIAMPAGFEQEVLARIRRDAVFREILQFGLPQLGRAFLEVLTLFFGFLPAPADQAAASEIGGGA